MVKGMVSKTRAADEQKDVSFLSVAFHNFKAFERYTISLKEMNILVGANNAGKSTILAPFRVLNIALKVGRSRNPAYYRGPSGHDQLGYNVSVREIPISLENVHTNYNREPSSIIFTLSNKTRLTLYFPEENSCYLFVDTDGRPPRTTSDFKKAVPVTVGVVPVLGPVEHAEKVVKEDTVTENLSTHRAARNFRNYWYYNRDGDLFSRFAGLIRETWAGMDIEIPRPEYGLSEPTLSMFCTEGRFPRELFWIGFGFQSWCQLLTHIVRNQDATLLIVDEPETYLHPDVQRKLLGILRRAGPAVMLATHSSEIISEAEHDELVFINKKREHAKRVSDSEGVQQVLDAVGSLQNVTLIQLARTKKLLFVEGEDFKLIARFARKLDLPDLAASIGFTVIPSGGFARWSSIKDFAWGLEKTVGKALSIGIVLDRDFRPDSEIERISDELKERLSLVCLHKFKEIENLLIRPEVLERAANRKLRKHARNRGLPSPQELDLQETCASIAHSFEDRMLALFMTNHREVIKREHPKWAENTVNAELISMFKKLWQDPARRMESLPGKEYLRLFNTRLQQEFQISLTHSDIVDAFKHDELHPDLIALIQNLERFRLAPV